MCKRCHRCLAFARPNTLASDFMGLASQLRASKSVLSVKDVTSFYEDLIPVSEWRILQASRVTPPIMSKMGWYLK